MEPASRSGAAPAEQTPSALLALQRSAGNAAVTRLLGGAPIQRARFADAEPAAAGRSPAGGGPLAPEVRDAMESHFATDLAGVIVHADSDAAPELGAAAFTQGDEIHFAPGRYDPGSAAGQQLLAHELAHVVQQRQGRVTATGRALGLPVNDDARLERESETAAASFSRGPAGTSPAPAAAPGGGPAAAIQMAKFKSQKAAIEWLEGQRERNDDEEVEDYLQTILEADKTYGTEKDLKANLQVLKLAYSKAAKSEKKQAKSRNVNTAPVRKRTISAGIWNHIANGELKDDGVPKGYHTLVGDAPVAEAFGNKTNHLHGCYSQSVRSVSDQTKVKPDGSTFFPTTWTAQHIRDAIEFASELRKNQLYETTAQAPVAGLRIWFNGNSYFPYFD